MLVRPVNSHWEMFKWMGIGAVAATLLFLLAEAVGAADVQEPTIKPPFLPQDSTSTQPLAAQRSSVTQPADDIGLEVWRILDLHRERKLREAIDAWNATTFPAETNCWKYIALAQAHIAIRDLAAAEDALDSAERFRPDNALAHYFRAILRLEQAFLSDEWPDAVGPKPARLAAYRPPHVIPNTKSMLRLAAMTELEKAIEQATTIWRDESLIPSGIETQATVAPTVGDLLWALGGENFEAKSHHLLSELFLERGDLELAEEHMDNAVSAGMANLYGYEELADHFQARGRYPDAMRAYVKAILLGRDKARPAKEIARLVWEVATKP